MVDFREIAEFIRAEVPGCKFVGITDDHEVFIEFRDTTPELEISGAQIVKEKFPHISKITIVVKPSIEQVKKMVDDLNGFLEETEKEISTLRAEFREKLQRYRTLLEKTKVRAQSKISEYSSKLKQAKEQIESQTASRLDTEQKLEVASEQVTEFKQQLSEVRKRKRANSIPIVAIEADFGQKTTVKETKTAEDARIQ